YALFRGGPGRIVISSCNTARFRSYSALGILVRPSERRANAMPDHANFEQLYRSHYRRVRGLCRQLLGRADSADDAAQETFVRAYRAFDRYDPTQPFAAWIMTIASRYCIDVVRRRAKEAEIFGDAAAERAEPDSNDAS